MLSTLQRPHPGSSAHIPLIPTHTLHKQVAQFNRIVKNSTTASSVTRLRLSQAAQSHTRIIFHCQPFSNALSVRSVRKCESPPPDRADSLSNIRARYLCLTLCTMYYILFDETSGEAMVDCWLVEVPFWGGRSIKRECYVAFHKYCGCVCVFDWFRTGRVHTIATLLNGFRLLYCYAIIMPK